MTLEQRKIALQGRQYWAQYVSLNGYAFTPTSSGLTRLSQQTNINKRELAKCITAYLES